MNNFLLEIGTEEIPAGYIEPALTALCATLQKKMTAARIEYGQARIFGTPRRLAIIIESVAGKQKPLKTELAGPPQKIGFDEHGSPTMAAIKFAEKAGVSVEKLMIKETEKGKYLFAKKTERGLATRKVLADILPAAILSTPFPKTMRWADLNIAFARPIHSIVALLGSQVIQFKLGNIISGRNSRGHYFLNPKKLKISSADVYLSTLRHANVFADIAERKKMVRQEVAKAAKDAGGHILADEELLDIVNNLVELPVAVAGRFDEAFLELPDEVLITAMREHQKYFAIVDQSEKLRPYFVAVNNTAARDINLVAKGHERVIRARLADAQFFYRSDLDISNDDRIDMLKRVLFQAELGTMYEKTERMARIAEFLVEQLNKDIGNEEFVDELKSQIPRSAKLCKADLVSQVVVEFPKLQGIMGRLYATVFGEPPTVAAAIEEHYRPVHSGAALPETMLGAILSIADKIDTICGCFHIGLTPTGASDPYALRRQGLGIIQIINDKGFSLSINALIRRSLELYMGKNTSKINELTENVYTFLRNRISHMLSEDGYSKDVIAAVVNVTVDQVPHVWLRVEALQQLKIMPDFDSLAIAFKRVVNLIKKSDLAQTDLKSKAIDLKLFEHDSESALYEAYKHAVSKIFTSIDQELFSQALLEIAALRAPVDDFFNDVMVMTEDIDLRQNRLCLLGKIAELFEDIADFSKIST
jgi:glycyl-tRNA synthetase beta chain